MTEIWSLHVKWCFSKKEKKRWHYTSRIGRINRGGPFIHFRYVYIIAVLLCLLSFIFLFIYRDINGFPILEQYLKVV
ncbi:hypothetical protein BRADI_3g06815v3 [Brachypodium distachyon]|uniref:Uncharacterized protein n=1 Tax=Brachypodium distachyon TaxID=15368 RepID=A0A0Q3PWL4_BRADI|nr:hypothetical protein BRADI_3g06815v3 [Brachypodium distachyon]